MKFDTTPQTPNNSQQLTAIAIAFLAAAAGPLRAQTIANPGFETDSFSVFPGYVSLNPPGITGWTGSPADRYGLNPATSSPFADNGTVPEGNNVALIQSTATDTITELDTDITGLTPGTVYRLGFRVNVRASSSNAVNLANLSVSVGGQELLHADAAPVGGVAPYHYVYVDFTASTASEALVLRNNQTLADTTLLVDDFTIAPAPAADPAWSVEEWTDDSNSGVDPLYRYTHAYSLGTATGTTINDIPFIGVPGTTPFVSGKFMLTGMTTGFANDTGNLLSGGSLALVNDFIYGGNPGVLTLQGLAANTSYVVTLYSTGWEDPGKRPIMFMDGDKRFSADQDTFGANNGVRFVHTYTSAADGTALLSFQGLGGTLHLYGFSNREASPQVTAAPVFALQPLPRQALTGSTVTFSAAATGQPVPTYQWLYNGTAISGEQNPTLDVSIADASQSGAYSVQAINSAGTTTSNAVYLEVLEPALGPLFATGVDDTGVPLSPAAADTHYTLTENQGGDANIPAVVENPPTAWLANSDSSAWVGPLADTSKSPAGRFTYRTTVDAGQNPDTFALTGLWATDDTGTEIRINDTAISGLAPSAGFTSFSPFNISKANAPTLKAGLNTVDFVVGNGAAGFTGLRIASVKVPDGVPPVVVESPLSQDVSSGDTVTLGTRAYGTAPVTYTWYKEGVAVPGVNGPALVLSGVSGTAAGSYTVKATNSLGSSSTSSAAVLRVLSTVPGFGSTGLAADGTPLADGSEDPRYLLSENPDGLPDAPAIVHNTAGFPIGTGTWNGPSDSSKWISSRLDSVNAPVGNYVYRTTLDLTGFDPASTIITGSWTSDDSGKALRVNGTATGLTTPGTFAVLTPFRIDDSNANFVSGLNTLEFVVENGTPGYTGLRVDGLRAIARATTTTGTLPDLSIQLSSTGKPVISFTGTAGATYTIQRSTTLGGTGSPWATIGQPVAPANGVVQFEDDSAPAGRGFYHVVLP